MEAKEYLSELYYLNTKIKEDKRHVARLKEQADKRTSSLSPDKVQGSGSQQKQANIVCEWVALEQQIAEDEAKAQEIINTINMLRPHERTVVYQCYRYDKSLGEVARDIHRSYSWVTKFHGSGIKRIQQILDEREARN